MFRNHRGDRAVNYMKGILYTTNTVTELLALIHGLRIALQQKMLPLEITTDSIEVIRMITEGHLLYNSIVCECKSLMEQSRNLNKSSL